MMKRRALKLLLILPAMVVAVIVGRVTAPERSDTEITSRPSRSPSPVSLVAVGGVLVADVDTELTEEYEPYEYSRPAPRREPTPLDGFYVRIVTLQETGGPSHGLPFRCVRCLPFRISPGLETLTVYEGRFYLDHQMSGFRALGHFRLEGKRIEFFNDPNCSSMTGTYEWKLQGTSLAFDVVRDRCPFKDERADDLTYSPWTKVDACAFRIVHWWPGLFGC
jgi:hypothetical protein